MCSSDPSDSDAVSESGYVSDSELDLTPLSWFVSGNLVVDREKIS